MMKPILNDEQIFPSADVLKNILGENYSLYSRFMSEIQNAEFGFNAEWRYYNDGKSWLCKISFGKKTIIWLSVWDGYFKCSLYFNEKYSGEVEKLDISPELKSIFINSKNFGKLKPVTIDVKSEINLFDVLKTAILKRKLK